MPHELVLDKDHNRGRSMGSFVASWIEHFAVHGPGDVQGERVVLDDDKLRFILDSYALKPDGRRLYKTVVLSRPKGSAKSEDSAFFALAEMLAPVRFNRWAVGGEVYKWRDFMYEYEPGEPIGERVTYPFVRCMATEESQSGNTYDNIFFNLTDGPLSETLPRSAAGITRIVLPEGGECWPSTASSASKDGGKETFVVFDETHLYTSVELKRMYSTIDRNLRKRRAAEPWGLQTTTMYESGFNSVAESTHDRSKLQLEGKTRAGGLMWDHREGPAKVDLTSRSDLTRALREAYGPFSEVLDLDDIIDQEFFNINKDPEESRRYFLNQPTASRDAWVTVQQWKTVEDTSISIDEDAPMVMFFDGSKSSDATGLVGCDVATGHVMTLAVWERPEGPEGEGWEVPRGEVDSVVREVFRKRNVVAFFADVKEFESYVDQWGIDFRDRLQVFASTGKSEHPVAWDMRGKVQDFTDACARAYEDITNEEITHDGDARLARHVANARRRPNRFGVSIGKESRSSMRKIDLAVCMIGARHVRRLVLMGQGKHSSTRKVKKPGRVIAWG